MDSSRKLRKREEHSGVVMAIFLFLIIGTSAWSPGQVHHHYLARLITPLTLPRSSSSSSTSLFNPNLTTRPIRTSCNAKSHTTQKSCFGSSLQKHPAPKELASRVQNFVSVVRNAVTTKPRSKRVFLLSIFLIGLALSCFSPSAMASTAAAVVDPSSVAIITDAATEATIAATAPAVSHVATTLATHQAAALLAASPVSGDVEFRLSCRLLYAAFMGGCLGKERSFAKHSAGVRTMALVSMGAAAYTVCSSFGFLAFSHYDPSRMAANVASGVGFVGAGVITTTMTDNRSVVHGLTTAAAIWLSAAVGVACGVGLFRIATTAAFSTIAILRLGRVKPKQQPDTSGSTSSSSSSSSLESSSTKILPEPVLSSSPNHVIMSHDDEDVHDDGRGDDSETHDPETHDTGDWDELEYRYNQTDIEVPTVMYIPYDDGQQDDMGGGDNVEDAPITNQDGSQHNTEEVNTPEVTEVVKREDEDIFPMLVLREKDLEKVVSASVLTPVKNQTGRAP